MGRGLVPLGYKYLGPFNDLERGEPTNENDKAAKKHDEQYTKLGTDAYWQYNEADEEFLQQLNPNDIPTNIAKTIFQVKRAIAPKHKGKSFVNLLQDDKN